MYTKNIEQKLDIKLGYMYFMDKKHPLASSNGKVYLHRHIASLKLGRWLHSEEIVHHIDGNKRNNKAINLVILSKNNHAREHALRRYPSKKPIKCLHCSILFSPANKRSKYCSVSCFNESNRRFHVSKNELRRLVWKIPTSSIAKRYSVSDTAISKWCKKYGIVKPSRGYWSRSK